MLENGVQGLLTVEDVLATRGVARWTGTAVVLAEAGLPLPNEIVTLMLTDCPAATWTGVGNV
jgi:hypothetical protein